MVKVYAIFSWLVNIQLNRFSPWSRLPGNYLTETTMNDDDDLLGIAGGKYPAKSAKSTRAKVNPKDTELYALLKMGLPDFVKDGVLQVQTLAKTIGISYQAAYKWFERGTVSPQRITALCDLSESTKAKPFGTKEKPWKPLSRNDFWPFMGG